MALTVIGITGSLWSPSDAAAPGVSAAGLSGGQADRQAVRVQHRSGSNAVSPCPPLEKLPPPHDPDWSPWGKKHRRYAGGCVLRARGESEMRYLSAVQDMRFARCEVRFQIRLDARGTAVIDRLVAYGGSPCNDIYGCYDNGPPRVWRGHLAMTGGTRIRLYVDVCLDTCIGRFAGSMTLRLSPVAPGVWRVDGTNARVGTSGWRFTAGSWTLRSRPAVEIRPREGVPGQGTASNDND